MKLPDNPDFYLKAAVCIVIVLGTIAVQATTGTIPDWLLTAFGSVIVFVLGVSTNPRRD